jgi:hypothetical protein
MFIEALPTVKPAIDGTYLCIMQALQHLVSPALTAMICLCAVVALQSPEGLVWKAAMQKIHIRL